MLDKIVKINASKKGRYLYILGFLILRILKRFAGLLLVGKN